MLEIYLLGGPDEELLHQCAARMSTLLDSPLILRATSFEQSFQALDELPDAQGNPQVVLLLPWSASLTKWCSVWRHREGHRDTSDRRLCCVALCLAVENVDSHLTRSHLVDEMNWAERYIESIEAASLIIVNEPCERTASLCTGLSPNVDLCSLDSLRPLPNRFERPQTAWQALINEEKLPSAPSVQRFLFSARRPFDKQRLSRWLRQPLEGLIRVRGFFWVADSPHVIAQLSVAGSYRSWTPVGTWWIGMRRSHWPEDPLRLARIQGQWHPDFGDRIQALGCIGINCDAAEIRENLEACLLQENELGAEWKNVAMVPNPFPG